MSSLSRRGFLRAAAQVSGAALLTGCVRPALASDQLSRFAFADFSGAVDKPPVVLPSTQPYPLPEASLDVMIGQMLLVGFGGTSLWPEAEVLQAIRAGKLGSVVLFGHNLVDAAQVRALTDTLRAAATIPLLITVDQEGGYVSRLGPWSGINPNYSEQYLGEINDLRVTTAQAASTAITLRQLGINLNLAPVVDLNLNPYNPVIGGVQRSYSSDPDIVAAHAAAAIDAHRIRGVGCTLKHFPGHGSSRSDTHLGFVDVTDTWETIELAPYIKLIAAGKVDAIMTAHIFNATLDPELPATLSKAVITGLLREKMGYDGVVVSDDMRMRAISDIYEPEDAILKVIEAGVDLIAISNNIPGKSAISPLDAFDIIRAMVESGQISEERITQSYRRIVRLKAALNLVTLPEA
jgi:beta-N-acetylhexosaminidase